MVYNIEKPMLQEVKHVMQRKEVTPQNTIVYESGEEPFENRDIQTQLTDQGLIITQQDYNISRSQKSGQFQTVNQQLEKSNYSAFTQIKQPQNLVYQGGDEDDNVIDFNSQNYGGHQQIHN